MASPEILDFEKLLAPISDDQPSGVELKDDPQASPIYYQIKDAREAARLAERRLAQLQMLGDDADEGETVESPNWHPILETGKEILATRSKDLWVASWLIEALCREHGFAGLRDGFRLTREIIDRFWDKIHPQPDAEDGYGHTVAQLTGLNGEEGDGALIVPIEDVPICNSPSRGLLSSTDYKRAVDLEQTTDPDVRARRLEQGALTLPQFENAVKETPVEFLRNTLEDIEQALDEFRKLDLALEKHCGNDADGYALAPPTSNIRNALQECLDRLRSLARDILGAGGEDEAAEKAGGIATTDGKAGPPGKVATREDAFRALLQVADFFRRTEPHSPVSYALEQAVRWGRMSLPDLLTELIRDDSTRRDLFKRTGIPQPNDDD
jgi:type VI secretion system protein ImpA